MVGMKTFFSCLNIIVILFFIYRMEQPNIRKRYNETYYRRHKAKLNETYWCATCGGFFSMPNRSNHLKTGKHMRGVFEEAVEREMEVEHRKMGLVCHSDCAYFAVPIYKRSLIYVERLE